MKKIFSVLLCFVLLCSFTEAVRADESLLFVIDDGYLLSAEEEMQLKTEIHELRKKYGFDVVILTLESLEGSRIETFADHYYDSVNYSEDGVLLVLSMEEREWYISTCGDAIYALTDYGISRLGEEILPYLADGMYYEAFTVYLQELPEYFDAFLSGSPIDGYADYSGDYYHGMQEDVLYYENSSGPNIFLSGIIGLVVAAIAILIMRNSMNSKRRQSSAISYMKNGSYHLRTHQDLFLYSNTSKIRRQENNNSGGGGSSVHRSSGGRHHGGGGGKF